MSSPEIGRLHIITDVSVQSRYTHAALARMAIDGGAGCIQFRDKHLKGSALVAEARNVVAQTSGRVPLIIDDHVDVAAAVAAEGVHVGQQDASVETARAAVGPNGLVGVSTFTLEQAHAAQAAGADYIGFGHIFHTGSKNKSGPPLGLDALARICAAVTIPVIAIGGISAVNAASVFDAGAWGIAVIADVCAADDPQKATSFLAAIAAEKHPA